MFIVFFVFILVPRHKSRESGKIGPHPRGHPSSLRNDRPSMDEWYKHWSMIVHGDGSKRLRIAEDATSGDFRILKPP
jgi:hypothetical protein